MNTVARLGVVVVDVAEACRQGLAIQSIRCPRSVSSDRIFDHESYLMERDGRPLPVTTKEAWRVGEEAVVFL